MMKHNIGSIKTSREAERLSLDIGSLLAGHDPDLVGASLGFVVARYLSGINPRLREETFELFIKLVRDLIPIEERELKDWLKNENPWEEAQQ